MREALKSIRAELGLSQAAFAERAGVTPGYIALIETGKRQLSEARVYQVAQMVPLTDEQRDRLLASRTVALPIEARMALVEAQNVAVLARLDELEAMIRSAMTGAPAPTGRARKPSLRVVETPRAADTGGVDPGERPSGSPVKRRGSGRAEGDDDH